MNKRKVAVGPGASSLILIAVVLALSVLTVLTMIAARNDEALAIRSAETRDEVYSLFAKGERSFAALDGVLLECLGDNPEDPDAYLKAVKAKLPEGMKMKGDTVSWTESSDSRTLECAVRVNAPGAEKRAAWSQHSLIAGDIWEEDDWGDFDDDWDDDDWGDEDEWGDEEESDSEEDAPEDDEAVEDTDQKETTEEDEGEEFE